jgi:hypothetical protein
MNARTKASNREVRALLACLGTALALGTAAAYGADVKVTLSGNQEVPPVQTAATGSGTIHVGDDLSVSGSVTTQGISGTMGHIHTGAAGKNGPVLIHLQNTGDGVWSVPAGTKFTPEQLQQFKSGELYINVHSAAHEKGEIRGQIKP